MDPDVVEIPPPIHQTPSRFKKQKQTVFHDVIDLEGDDDLLVLGETSRKRRNKGKAVVSPGLTTITDEPENETLKKLRSFKQFETVVDISDHHYVTNNSSMKQNPKSWAKKIQDEWKILEKHLPETIYVRVFESRMDLLRAVIIGAEGTPYQDGLFFFDVLFPSGYPNVPPQVHYHAGGLRLNPNLYGNGNVCLSLLNTWSGSRNEKWTPGVSTMLQVLVSIQGLILNAKPYFNEPGYASTSGTQNGEAQSLKYNENTFILSVRTMMYTMKKPPKNFEDLVAGHFYSRAHDILASCKAYMEGVQVGCLVKGGVQDVDEDGGKSSDKFKADLLKYVKLLVKEFEKLGVKDCKKFISPTPTPLKLTTPKPTPSKLRTTRGKK
ncbi:putative ubiquitin-conjugating enzyme E2 38 [Trifolium pratense]|uniref:putative ubiquitin-conjugating enzyme E2 38 n=1 Tax=Trifolium pratense TaxID=57577 RepID=UPI001E6913B6|nr:putative ubiquitin-conjugating enzyme E2 38 [Trifolium pratense]